MKVFVCNPHDVDATVAVLMEAHSRPNAEQSRGCFVNGYFVRDTHVVEDVLPDPRVPRGHIEVREIPD